MGDRTPIDDPFRKLFRGAVKEYLARFPLGGGPAPDDWATNWCDRYPPELSRDLNGYHEGRKEARARADRGEAEAIPAPAGTLADVEFSGDQKEGAMGVVFRGRDRFLNRTVCVKRPKGEFATDRWYQWRSYREAQILGSLQHPNIPPVYRFGRDADGTPFFVMKWVEGTTLADRAEGARGRERFGRLVDIFLQVCRAVGYAHTAGVLHRDLKPTNVMVEPDDAVYVVDWGIGTLIDAEAGGTAAGPTAPSRSDSGPSGTPAFRAPEQEAARAALLPAADVFGLGGILCHIMTGHAPGWAGGERGLTDGRASPVRTQLAAHEREHPELVALALACLAKEPGRRPADGNAVARAVQDYLNGITERLIRANAEAAQRVVDAHKAAARRRVRNVLIVSAFLIAGGAGYGALARGERRARNGDAVGNLVAHAEQSIGNGDPATCEVDLAEIDRRLPEGGADAHRDRVERCRTNLALVRGLNRVDTVRWMPVDGHYPTAGAVAAQWEGACRRFGIEPGKNPAREDAQRVTTSLAQNRLLGALDLWLVNEPTAGLRDVLSAADPDTYRGAVRAAVLAEHGSELAHLAGRREALEQPPWFAAVLGQIPAIDRVRRREILELALRNAPGDLNLLMALGETYPINQRAGAEHRVRWAQAVVAANPGSVAARNALGIALRDSGDLDGAIRECAIATKLDPKYAVPHHNLGAALFAKSQRNAGTEFAKPLRTAATAAYEEALRLEPRFPQARNGLGNVHKENNDPDGAVREYAAAIALDPKYAHPHYGLGDVLKERGEFAGAIDEYEIAIALAPDFAPLYVALGDVLAACGDLDRAVEEYRAAVKLAPENAGFRNNLGNALGAANDPDGAIGEYRAAVELAPENAGYRNNLGNALKSQNELAGAVREYTAAIKLDPHYADPYHGLGNALFEKGNRVGARLAYEQAARLKSRISATYTNLAIILTEDESPYAARQVLLAGLQVDPRFRAAFRYDLACITCLVASGRVKDAPEQIDPRALRREVLTLLTDELAFQEQFAAQPVNRSLVQQTVSQWLRDGDLMPVRDIEALPADERPPWDQFWSRVRALQKATAPAVAPAPRLVK